MARVTCKDISSMQTDSLFFNLWKLDFFWMFPCPGWKKIKMLIVYGCYVINRMCLYGVGNASSMEIPQVMYQRALNPRSVLTVSVKSGLYAANSWWRTALRITRIWNGSKWLSVLEPLEWSVLPTLLDFCELKNTQIHHNGMYRSLVIYTFDIKILEMFDASHKYISPDTYWLIPFSVWSPSVPWAWSIWLQRARSSCWTRLSWRSSAESPWRCRIPCSPSSRVVP
jgi:hypothetical protein